MTHLYQLRAFALWMVRKGIRLPMVLLKQVGKGLEFVANAVYEDGALGVFLAFLVSMLGFMLVFISGGIYLEVTKEEGVAIEIGQVAPYGAYGFASTATVIFFYTCWYCFRREQDELIEKLKDRQHG